MTLSHRLRVGAATSPFSFNDAAYSNFFTSGASPLDFDNSSVDTVSSFASGFGTNGGYSTFYDHSQSKQYDGYTSAGSDGIYAYDWSQGGNNYNNSADFYQVNLSNYTKLNSFPSGHYSRGVTVAYLGDGTAVFVVSFYASSYRFYFYQYPSGTLIGYLNQFSASSTGQNDPDVAGENDIVFSGTHILYLDPYYNPGYIFGYDLPANTSAINSSSTISTSARWTISSTSAFYSYGMAYTGDGVIYNKAGSTIATYDRLSGNGQVSGYSGTHTFVRNFNGTSGNNYGVGIDYKNRKLILGGVSNNTYHVYGE